MPLAAEVSLAATAGRCRTKSAEAYPTGLVIHTDAGGAEFRCTRKSALRDPPAPALSGARSQADSFPTEWMSRPSPS